MSNGIFQWIVAGRLSCVTGFNRSRYSNYHHAMTHTSKTCFGGFDVNAGVVWLVSSVVTEFTKRWWKKKESIVCVGCLW